MRVEDKGYWFEIPDNGTGVIIGTPDGAEVSVPMNLIEHIWYLR